ncbi:MAG: V-type ATP synthase subunit F [Kofleriaceae bacterium]
MRARLRAICTHETALGFALSGIAPVEAQDGLEAARVLDSFATMPASGGVVFIESVLYDALPAATRRRIRREGLPILMPFPSPAFDRAIAPEQELLDVLRRAVGYRMRLR